MIGAGFCSKKLIIEPNLSQQSQKTFPTLPNYSYLVVVEFLPALLICGNHHQHLLMLTMQLYLQKLWSQLINFLLWCAMKIVVVLIR